MGFLQLSYEYRVPTTAPSAPSGKRYGYGRTDDLAFGREIGDFCIRYLGRCPARSSTLLSDLLQHSARDWNGFRAALMRYTSAVCAVRPITWAMGSPRGCGPALDHCNMQSGCESLLYAIRLRLCGRCRGASDPHQRGGLPSPSLDARSASTDRPKPRSLLPQNCRLNHGSSSALSHGSSWSARRASW